ncbi:MAG: HEAT repeat domain-containing protein [Myxococcota bacterium]
MADDEKRDTKSLVQSILAKKPEIPAQEAPSAGPELPQEPPPTPAATELPREETASDHPEHSAAAELIELYFTLDEPLERDACFDEIAALQAPVVTEFLRAMLQGDADEYVRAAAASELARRGDPEGRAAVEADLADPENIDFFTNALQTLADLDGEAFYERLLGMWRDDARDDDLTLEVLSIMEAISPARACRDFAETLSSVDDPEAFRDDQFELMVLTFVRNGYQDAESILLALRQRAAQFSMDEEERSELVAFVDEGIALLRGES